MRRRVESFNPEEATDQELIPIKEGNWGKIKPGNADDLRRKGLSLEGRVMTEEEKEGSGVGNTLGHAEAKVRKFKTPEEAMSSALDQPKNGENPEDIWTQIESAYREPVVIKGSEGHATPDDLINDDVAEAGSLDVEYGDHSLLSSEVVNDVLPSTISTAHVRDGFVYARGGEHKSKVQKSVEYREERGDIEPKTDSMSAYKRPGHASRKEQGLSKGGAVRRLEHFRPKHEVNQLEDVRKTQQLNERGKFQEGEPEDE